MAALRFLLLTVLLLGASCAEQTEPRKSNSAPAPQSRPRLELPAPAELRSGFVRVFRVVDGDTLVLARNERLRLIGVNCDEVPEPFDAQSPGWKAALWVQSLLEPEAQIRLEFDEERTDKYGRTLAYAWLTDGRMLNALLLEHGQARIMRIAPNTRHAADFAALERGAKSAGRGRWQR